MEDINVNARRKHREAANREGKVLPPLREKNKPATLREAGDRLVNRKTLH